MTQVMTPWDDAHDIISDFGRNGSAHVPQPGSSQATRHALPTCHLLVS